MYLQVELPLVTQLISFVGEVVILYLPEVKG